jgi:DNA-binding GntR family transcriptional regulator
MAGEAAQHTDFNGSGTLTTRIHDLLEEAIISGRLAPGERIHADALAAQYGTSRIPVREALRSLDEAGWVEIRPRYGVHVRERTSTELDELFEFRASIEELVAQWAAQRRTQEEAASLKRIVSDDRATSDDAVDRASSDFYVALRAAAHNSVLASTSAVMEKRARFYFSTVLHELGHDWLTVHEQLADHVHRRDAAAAGRLARSHIEATGQAVRDLLFPGVS